MTPKQCLIDGAYLEAAGRYGEAVQMYDKGLALRPDEYRRDLRLNKAMCWLRLGDYARGWPDFELRWLPDKDMLRTLSQSWVGHMWSGRGRLWGKKIALWNEQGLGDSIMAARYIPLVQELVGPQGFVGVYLPSELVSLWPQFRHNWRGVHYDYHSPLMSLPHCFKTRIDSIPPPLLVEHPNPYTIGKQYDYIGLCWAGNPDHLNDANRSIARDQLIKGLGDGPYVSLQYDPKLKGWTMQETANLVTGTKLVITVDTAIAHLAGSMGHPTWVLLPFHADWRWGLGDTTPWYPSVRLFRQKQPGDWDSVFKEVRSALGLTPPALLLHTS